MEWPDIDFLSHSMKVTRAVVHGRLKLVKTEYSEVSCRWTQISPTSY
jgi:hypothetical protein